MRVRAHTHIWTIVQCVNTSGRLIGPRKKCTNMCSSMFAFVHPCSISCIFMCNCVGAWVTPHTRAAHTTPTCTSLYRYYEHVLSELGLAAIINPWCACAARITVLVLCVCLSVCASITRLVCIYYLTRVHLLLAFVQLYLLQLTCHLQMYLREIVRLCVPIWLERGAALVNTLEREGSKVSRSGIYYWNAFWSSEEWKTKRSVWKCS